MYTLQTKSGTAVLMNNGTPFQYSSRELAYLGKRLLEVERKESYTVISHR